MPGPSAREAHAPGRQGAIFMNTLNDVQDGHQFGAVEAPVGTATEMAATTPQTSSAAEPAAGAEATATDAPADDAQDFEQNKVYAIVGYIGILFLVPLLAAPNSRFARYHANQGIVLFLATIVVTGAFYVLGHIPILGRVLGLVGSLAWIASLVLMVLGIVNAASGKCQPLPFLGRFQLLK
jgi:uncharacterized membrane protein